MGKEKKLWFTVITVKFLKIKNKSSGVEGVMNLFEMTRSSGPRRNN